MEAVGIFPAAVDIRPVVVGFAFSGPLYSCRLFFNEPMHWGPRYLVPSCVPFAENDDCFADDNLPAVDIVATAGGFASLPAIAVAVTLVVPAIDLGGAEFGALVLLL